MKQASMDRLDHKKSYTKNNIRFVSIVANIARNSFSDNQLYEFCKAVYEKGLRKIHSPETGSGGIEAAS